MKATELQIGDWVYYKYSAPEPWQPRQWRIVAFEGNFIELANPETSCKPIPLTPEILEKNGWKKHATYGSAEDETLEEIYMLYQHSFEVVFNNKEAISIRHFVSEEDDGYDKLLIEHRDNGYKPMYVHILQHAFLFFELDDLANNFQID